MYTALSWRPAESLTTATWMDLSGSGNHVTEIGGATIVSVARPVGAPAYIHGATTAWMKFPEGILPSAEYTLLFVARYNGPTRGRIFQGINSNWFSGFFESKTGVAYHGDSSSGGCIWITNSSTDVHGYDWVVGTDRKNSFRSNGVDRTTKGVCNVFDRLAINVGSMSGETSDFAVQSALVYNRRLADSEVQMVEAWLAGIITDGLVLYMDPAAYVAGQSLATTSHSTIGSATASLQNGVAFSPSYGGVFDFDGQDDFIQLPDSSFWNSNVFGTATSFSIECWYKPDVFRNYGLIVTKWNPAVSTWYSSSQGASIWSYSQGFAFSFGSGASSNPPGGAVLKGYATSTLKWYHLCFTGDGTTLRIYVDGIERAPSFDVEGTYVNVINLVASRTVPVTTSSHGPTFGRQSVDGQLGNVKFYTRALSAGEVSQNYGAHKLRFGIGGIVSDGLVFCMDPARSSTAPSSSTTTYSMIGGFTASLQNGVAFSPSYGGVLDFDGQDDFIQLPDSSFWNSNVFGTATSFSIECWYKPDVFRNWDTIVMKSDPSLFGYHSPSQGASIWSNADGFQAVFASGVLGNGPGSLVIIDIKASTLKWYHLCFTGDGVTLRFYVDGIERGTALVASRTVPVTTSSHGPIFGRSTNRFSIDGQLGNVKLYIRALSAGEVSQNYGAHKLRFGIGGIVSDGLVFYMDPARSSTAPSSSTTTYSMIGGFTASLQNGVAFSPSYGGVLDFDGQDDFIQLPDSSFWNGNVFGTATSFSIECWYKPDVFRNYGLIVTKWNPAVSPWYSSSQGASIWSEALGFAFSFGSGVISNPNGGVILKHFITNTLKWYHLCFTGDGVTLRFYVDGIERGTALVASRTIPVTTSSHGPTFGRRSEYMDGQLGSVRFYTRALSAVEVSQNYAADKSRFSITSVTFNIAPGDRFAGKSGSAATFSFMPSAGGAGPSAVTLNYPPGFFASSSTPTATCSSSGAVLIPGTPGSTSIVLATSGTALAADVTVTLTLTGLTMGNATAGGAVSVQTSADTFASASVPSGVIVCAAGAYCEGGVKGPVACVPGTVLVATGAVSSSSCVPCPAGYYCLNAFDDPTPCPKGTQSNAIGATNSSVCLTCSASKYCAAQNMFPSAQNTADGKATFGYQGARAMYRVFDSTIVRSGDDIVYRFDNPQQDCNFYGYTNFNFTDRFEQQTSFNFQVDFFLSEDIPAIQTNHPYNPMLFMIEDFGTLKATNPQSQVYYASADVKRGVWITATTSLRTSEVSSGFHRYLNFLLYPGSCFPKFADSGYILFRNPRVFMLCPPGFFLAAGDPGSSLPNKCMPCTAGSYCEGGMKAPAICNAGRYCLSGSTTANGSGPCNAGRYCLAGSTTADGSPGGQCSAGTYSTAGSATCSPCNAGMYCLAGSTSATGSPGGTCSAGSFSTSGTGTTAACLPCPSWAHSAPGQAYCIGKALNTPTTGSAIAVVIGLQLGITSFSANHRFTGSSLESSKWLSDSCIQIRLNAGVSSSESSVVVSLPGFSAATIGTLRSTLSYNTPSPMSISSQSIGSISVIGSNFGPYLAVIPLSAVFFGSNVVSPSTSTIVLESSGIDLRNTGFTVTEAAASISFFNPTRLDDVIILLRSPEGKNYTLMKDKCFGNLPCSSANSVTFTFQILPVAPLRSVPVVACPSSAVYVPDDVELLRPALSSQSVTGTWSLVVATGSQSQNITLASIHFKKSILEVHIGKSSATSLVWASDSSVLMKSPGYQNAQGTESASGWGQNRPVEALNSGLSSPSLCVYSYPEPVLTGTVVDESFSASGSTRVLLSGRHFSNTNSNPQVRSGFSVCAATRWLSDTSLSCHQSPSLGSIRKYTLSIEKSALVNSTASITLSPCDE